MRKPLTVGILAETKNKWERRSPLSPDDVQWLIQRQIPVEIQTSSSRIFKDEKYKAMGAKVVPKLKKASLILGVKEPKISTLSGPTVYMVFSHTTKGQKYNRPLLRAFIKNKVTLIDYEHIVDSVDQRLVFFGRFAGICGALDSLYWVSRRLNHLKMNTPLDTIPNALATRSLSQAKQQLKKVGQVIRKKGFIPRLSPFIIGILGHGNVAQGVHEILDCLQPIEIHPQDMRRFIQSKSASRFRIYKMIFNRETKLRSKTGQGFYFEEYLKNPKNFESNLDQYLADINILMNCSYWDKRYPRLVPENMIQQISRKKFNRLNFIADLSCDIKGSIEITQKCTTPDHPVFTYQPHRKSITDNPVAPGVGILAVDQLPCELPQEASLEFGKQIRDYVYQIAAHGILDITEHHALPKEIREAVICQEGKLAQKYGYLKKYL